MTIRPISTGNAGDAPSESCISYARLCCLWAQNMDRSELLRLQLLVSAMCALVS